MDDAPEDQLSTLSDELALIAVKMRRLAGRPGEVRLSSTEASPVQSRDSKSRIEKAEMARSIYALRRERSAIFGDHELFSEPAWDIMLDLYIASAEHKVISVSSACIGSGAPPTTGLRWLGVLAGKGLVERRHDPEDQRRVLVNLTATGITAMDTFFDNALEKLTV